MVITLVVPLRKIFGLEAYLTTKHFDAMAKLCLFTSLIVLYAYLSEFFLAWYSGEDPERHAFWNRLFGTYWWATWTMLVCNGFVPIMLWFKRIRHSIPALFVISIFINIGMWFERFVIIVTSLHRDYLPSSWTMFSPTFVDIGIFIGTIGFFFVLFLLYARTFPVIAQAEVKTILKSSGEKYKKLRDGNE